MKNEAVHSKAGFRFMVNNRGGIRASSPCQEKNHDNPKAHEQANNDRRRPRILNTTPLKCYQKHSNRACEKGETNDI